MNGPANIESVLANRRWLRHEFPFPHVTADNVFVNETYAALEQSFQILLQVKGRKGDRTGFAKTLPHYDAHIAKIPPLADEPLRLFLSRPWCDMLAGAFGVNWTGDVNAELHHHEVGSSNGRIHNDLNPGWFLGTAAPDSTNVSDNDLCSYKHGTCADPSARPRQTIRAVALIFYLANPKWRRGDGGETGLYLTDSTPLEQAERRAAPVNNSLVAFECTPYSFHTFLSNKRSIRNSLVMWLHRTREEAVARWGEHAIVKWATPGKSR